MRIKGAVLKAALVATLAVGSIGGQVWALPLDIPTQGVILTGQAKQDYISNEIKVLFQQSKETVTPFTMPDGWTKDMVYYEQVPVEHYHNERIKSNRVILQFHGGGYVAGMTDYHRTLALKEATLMEASDVYSVDYRLAPEYKYPAALEDAITVYKSLLAAGIEGQHIIIVGDSAGGNLAVALSLYLRDHQIEQPGVMLLASPWADFEHKVATSRTENATKDQVLGVGTPLYEAVITPAYAGTLAVSDAKLSVINANLEGLPPTLIQVGGNELFETEGEVFASNMAAAGNVVTLTVYPGMPHDFALLLPHMEESIDSLQEMKDFVNRYMN